MIYIGDMVKNKFGLFLFSQIQKYPSTSAKEENSQRCQFIVRILCVTMRP